MLSLFQLLALVFVFVILIRLSLRFSKRGISLGEYLLWFVVWLVLLLVIAFPGLTFIPARWLGLSRGVDVIVYISIAFLYLLVYGLYVKVEGIERELTKMVRKTALEKLKTKKSKDEKLHK